MIYNDMILETEQSIASGLFKDIEISAECVNYYCNLIKNDNSLLLNEDVLVEGTKPEAILNKFIKNDDKAKATSICKNAGKKIADTIKKNGINGETKKDYIFYYS